MRIVHHRAIGVESLAQVLAKFLAGEKWQIGGQTNFLSPIVHEANDADGIRRNGLPLVDGGEYGGYCRVANQHHGLQRDGHQRQRLFGYHECYGHSESGGNGHTLR